MYRAQDQENQLSFKLSHKAYLLIAVPLLFEMSFVGGLIETQDQLNRSYVKQAKLREILSLINLQIKSLPEAATSLALYGLKNEDRFREQFKRTTESVRVDREKLNLLIDDADRGLVSQFNESIDRLLHKFDDSESHLQSTNRFELVANLGSAQVLLKRATKAADQLSQGQQALILREHESEERLKQAINAITIGGVTFSILLSGLLAYLFYSQIARKLNRLEHNAYLLAADRPLGPVLSGNDELAQLDGTFHEMADAIRSLRRRELALLDNAAEIICSIDEKGRISNINRAVTSVLGYDPDELKNRSLYEFAAKDSGLVRQELQAAIGSEKAKAFQMTIKKRDDSVTDLSWIVIWNKEEKELFGVAHDITEQNKIEAFRREMVAMVSHDLRGPLTALQMAFELFEKGVFGELNERGKRKASQGTRVITRLNALINGLLDIEKLESGELQLDLSTAPISELTERAVDSVQNLAEQKGLILQMDVQPVEIFCDTTKVSDVIINLVHNAIKFSPDGGTVLITAFSTAGYIEVNVCDQGKGVPVDKREIIFERFKQSDPSGSIEAQGSGLGLAIAKGVITAHGGTIGVRSDDRWSSIFWFRIPRNGSPATEKSSK